jgi:hypothetical protein
VYIAEMKIEINKLLLMSQRSESESFFTPAVQDKLNELVEEGQIIYEYSSFSSLVVSMLASGTQDRGFEHGQSCRNIWAKNSTSEGK